MNQVIFTEIMILVIVVMMMFVTEASLILTMARHDICPKFYTARLLGK